MRRSGTGVAGALLFVLAGCPQSNSQIKNTPPGPGNGALTPPPYEGPAQDEAAFGGPPGVGGGKNVPGEFDFYVLSLSWSPQHCATRGKQLGPDDPQCGAGKAYGFIVHGLWPQYQHGYPQSCAVGPELDAALVQRVMRIMPSEKLIRHEWEKHGTCSGLPADQYFGHAEQLMTGLKVPDRFSAPKDVVSTSVAAMRQEFTAGNPSLPKDGTSMAFVCSGEFLQELRLCYGKDFQPRACSEEVSDTCPASISARPLNRR